MKLSQSEEVEESAADDEPMADQTEAIQAKQKSIEIQQQSIQALVDQEQDLLNQGATLAEAPAEQGEHQAKRQEIQSELKAEHHNLETLQQEMKDLKLQQGQYEEQKEAILMAAKVKSLQNNPIKTETALLASLGIGAFSVMGGRLGYLPSTTVKSSLNLHYTELINRLSNL